MAKNYHGDQIIMNQGNFNFGSGKQLNFSRVTGSTNLGSSKSTRGMTKIDAPSGSSIAVQGNLYKIDGDWYTDGTYTAN